MRAIPSPARAVLTILAGGGFGLAMSSIPSPHDPHVFWVGNLCAPWLVLSFLAGRLQVGRFRAVVAGALADIACVCGFYFDFLARGRSVVDAGGRMSTRHDLHAFASWLEFCRPWLLAALIGGSLYGLAGWLWRRDRHRVVLAAVMAAPFLAEPLLWTMRDHELKGPIVIWPLEIALGLAVFVAMARRRSPV